MTKEIKNKEELLRFAGAYLHTLAPETAHATFVGLSGDLGSGKTAFVQCVGATLGVTDRVVSPTFVIAKFYDLSRQKWRRLVHIDCYRMEDANELRALRWEELVADPGNLIMMEWPEKIKAYVPPDAHMLQFLFIDETTRRISA